MFSYRLELASKDRESLEKAWEDFLSVKTARLETLSALSEALRYDQNILKTAMPSLLNFIHSEFYTLETVLRERVVSDVRYSFEKSRKVPQEDRIEVIVQTAFKDGIIDIVRDYRYKLSQELEALDEKYGLKFKHTGLEKENLFEAEDFFGDDFKTGFLTHNIDLSIQKIQQAVKHSKAKEITALDAEIKTIVEEMFLLVKRDTAERVEALSLKFMDRLIDDLDRTLMSEKQKLADQEASLKSALTAEEEMQRDTSQSTLAIHEKMKRLEAIERELKGVQYV